MFPYTHAKSEPDVSVQFPTKGFHTTYLKIVNPSPNELIEFHYLVAVADAPATASELFHPLLKLCYCFCMWFSLNGTSVRPLRLRCTLFLSIYPPHLAFGYNPLKCKCGTKMVLLEMYYRHKRIPLEEKYKMVMSRHLGKRSSA